MLLCHNNDSVQVVSSVTRRLNWKRPISGVGMGGGGEERSLGHVSDYLIFSFWAHMQPKGKFA